MNDTRVFSITRTGIILFSVLLSVATLAPLIGNQFITGTIVNSSLLLAVATLGLRSALLIGIIPSIMALATGLLPVVLSPMIPFIILGNTVLIYVFDYFKNVNYWLGAITGAVLKFGLLTAVIPIVTGLLINKNAAAGVAYMMSWPQLVTALAGSLVAFAMLYLKGKISIH